MANVKGNSYFIRCQIGKIRWDNKLLDMLSEATGIPKISLRERIRALARALDIELPRWTRYEVDKILGEHDLRVPETASPSSEISVSLRHPEGWVIKASPLGSTFKNRGAE